MLTQLLMALFLSASVKSDTFPKGFRFGVATSSYQIEGAWNESGRGQSMWDWFTHTFPHKILDGSNGDIACDSYNKYKDDIALLDDLGVQFYRMSISWTRILPTGYINEVNWDGVDYYLRVFQELNEFGIEPLVTLYHWELPQNLNDIGGWTNERLVDIFGDYARLCYKLFGRYVKNWLTLNEPQISCSHGYSRGIHAPGVTLSGSANYLCAYVQLKAHAKAYHIYHDEFFKQQRGNVSIVLVNFAYEPNDMLNEDDVAQTEKAQQFWMGLFAHPIYASNWPQVVIDTVDTRSKLAGFARSRLPKFSQEEIDYISGTSDYFALNYYSTLKTYFLYNVTDVINVTSYDTDIGAGMKIDPTWPTAASYWLHDVPRGIRNIINWISKEYGNPKILITENGWSDDGSTLNDTERIHYLNGHLCHTLKAINEDNCTVIGYTHWSLLDNFEWSAGYTERFGIVSVNFTDPNRKRTPKASYSWFKDVILTGNIDCTGF